MKVVIQRPLGRPGTFANSLFEVRLRVLDEGSGWHVLEALKPLNEVSENPGLPVLHRGFFDAHLHMTWSGLYETDLDLRNCLSFEEAMNKISHRAREGGAFIRGYGWDESRWGMTLGSLARVCEERLPENKPILLYRVCGHSALANKNLRLKVRGSNFLVLVTDKDLPAVAEHIPPPSQKECEEAFLRAQTRVIRQGVSGVGDMSLDETTVSAIRELADNGKLQIDVQGVVDAGRAPSVDNSGPFQHKNIASVGPLDRAAVFSVQHWKKYLDGSLGSRTAWLSKAYDDAEVFGDSLQNTKLLVEQSREVLQEGFHLSFHAIGDAALDQVIEVGDRLASLMQSRRESPSSSYPRTRHRIEHAQVVRDDQIRKLAEQGFWMVFSQPHHRLGDQGFVAARLGRDRLFKEAYRAGAFLAAGVPIGLSSDAPVDEWSPEAVIRAAMTHENPAERLGFYEALWWYTTGSRIEAGLDPGKVGPGSTVFLTDLVRL